MELSGIIEQENIFKKVIEKGNVYLKIVGLKLDSRDGKENLYGRLRFRWFFVVTYISIHIDVFGQMVWLIGSFICGNGDIIDITFMLPCLTFSLMGSVKMYNFIIHPHRILKIINTLNKLKMERLSITKKHKNFEKKCVHFLNTANKIITWVIVLGLITFGVGPLLLTATIFYNTGEIKLFFPFVFSYPFNAFDIRVWPLLYAQQLWSAMVAICAIWGPDYVTYAIATFIIIHFFSLKQDIVNLIPKTNGCQLFKANDAYRVKFKNIVNYHNELLRCAELMEIAFTKTILFNVISSSVLICFNVFNITAVNNIELMAPYTAFLMIVLGQIFLLCYFGDVITQSSMEVRDAVYQCNWYRGEPAVVRDLIILILRANKPCKLTTFGFSDVNLRTFTKILSTSWSYLALLQTVYNKNKVAEGTT